MKFYVVLAVNVKPVLLVIVKVNEFGTYFHTLLIAYVTGESSEEQDISLCQNT